MTQRLVKTLTRPSLLLRTNSVVLADLHKQLLPFISLRFTHADGTRKMIGEREVVGYGINGSPIYIDCAAFPFPAIRFREPTPEIMALREKECGEWTELSLKEKKALYRYSFCQTYSEFQHFTPDWKLCVGIGLWSSAIGFFLSFLYHIWLYDEPPDTFQEDRRQAQLRRIIALEMNPVTGISSKWCYEKNAWK